jgi:lipoprotein-anchoring transpeptidase ErfK/SrfK
MGPFPLVVKMISRGNSPARFVARAAGAVLLAGGLVALGAAVLGGGCGKRGDEAAPAGAAKTPGQAGTASSTPATPGKPGARPATGKADAGKPEAGKAEAGKRGKKGASPAPAPVVIPDVPVSSLSDDELAAQVEALRRENARLAGEAATLVPQDPYILINTTLNRLTMKKGDQYILKDAVVSTGSNTELVDAKGARRWFFSTPKGVHAVKKKMIAPVWTKPDWAFVEEGEPIPGAQAEARFEEGTLGKYGLYFGGGYIIHGTLFQRFLGQSVTHGCVRVGDADLETVYANASVGTKIYIY